MDEELKKLIVEIVVDDINHSGLITVALEGCLRLRMRRRADLRLPRGVEGEDTTSTREGA